MRVLGVGQASVGAIWVWRKMGYSEPVSANLKNPKSMQQFLCARVVEES